MKKQEPQFHVSLKQKSIYGHLEPSSSKVRGINVRSCKFEVNSSETVVLTSRLIVLQIRYRSS